MLADPTSSWSLSTIIAIWSAGSAAASAPSPPNTRPGCRAGRTRADRGRRRARGARRVEQAQLPPLGAPSMPAARRSSAANSPADGSPTPHTGVRCRCRSSFSPPSLTSRSRWTASWGTRATGSSTATSVAAVGRDEPPGDAEVAVEPRVVEDPAVDLDAELPPPERSRVGSGLDPQAGGVGVGPDEAKRGCRPEPSGTRHAISAPPRTAYPAGGTSSQAADSSTRSNPGSRAIVDSTACHGDGDASR